MSETIRVVVADDEEIYRKALAKILGHAQGIELVATGKDGAEAVELCVQHDADVLLTDLEMPTMDGIEAIRRLGKKKMDCVPVVLTAHEESEKIFDAIRAGAMGYLLKTSNANDIVSAIRRAKDGESIMTPSVAAKVIADFRKIDSDQDLPNEHLYDLTERELEILEHIVEGLQNKDIAGKLFLAEKTVKNHVSNILKKLQVNSRTAAAMKAVKENIVDS
ncbi:MAG: response regulator transcription factor [Fimbriimonadales bacterium]|nr:response regulator transcription factor [Fimbriimonadales bacterium]